MFAQAALSQGIEVSDSEETAQSKWQHYDYNDDVAILVKTGDRHIWQIGNIEQIGYLRRVLPINAPQERIMNNFHLSEPFPKRVSIHDEKAVFTLRIYRECGNAGHVLQPSENHPECINTPPFVFHLPMGETSLEPAVWTQASSILTSVRMFKDPLHQRLWRLNTADRNPMMRLYRAESGGPE